MSLILEKWTNVLENCLASLKSLNLQRNTVKPILLVFINLAMNLKIKTTKYSINKVTLFGIFIFNANCIRIVCNNQRWSRGHKARGQGQGHKKNPRPRPRTAFPRTDSLEAKDRNARGQGPRTQAQVLFKKKKTSQNFLGDLQKKKKKKGLHKNFQGQANFRGLEASRPRPRT